MSANIVKQLTGITDYAPSVKHYVETSTSDATRRAYASDWQDYTGWCSKHGVQALPASPDVISAYLAELAANGKKYSTIARRVASISTAHQAAGIDSPTRDILVRKALRGIGRETTVAKRQAVPLRIADLRRIVYTMPDTLQNKRDKALLLVGYVMAARRSEVVSLNVNDVEFTADGMRLTIRRSKTDQSGAGETFGINLCVKDPSICPVTVLKSWLEAAGIQSGSIFRGIDRHGNVSADPLNDKTVERVIRRYAPECSGHSLRAGFITDQYAVGTPEAMIAERSRHKSRAVLGQYRREANVFAFDYLSAVL